MSLRCTRAYVKWYKYPDKKKGTYTILLPMIWNGYHFFNMSVLPVVISMIRRTVTANQLKQSWTVAAEKARSYCSLLVMWVRETKVLVMLVPMLAPITMGMAILTEMMPEATMDTTTVVQVEELCTNTVKSTPIIKPTIGLDRRALPWNTEPALNCEVVSTGENGNH